MTRRKPLLCVVDELECRTLLSGITYSVTTDQSTYQVGQPIQLTFTETNSGDQPVTVDVAPTDFTVSDAGVPIWQSDATAAGQPDTAEVLQPGQSITQMATWDGTIPYTLSSPNGPTTTSALNEWGAFQVTNLNAASGASASFQIADPLAQQLATDQSVYQLGQPIQVTYTETNTASQPVTFIPGTYSGLTFWLNGSDLTPIVYPQVISADPVTMAAGQAFSFTQSWNGIPYSGPYDLAHLTGEFTAAYGPENDPTEVTANFEIAAPSSWDIASSITTDQTHYLPGQSVNVTLAETNDGSEPAPALVGQRFAVTQGISGIATLSVGPAAGLSWETLVPGQSVVQTATWDQLDYAGGLVGIGLFSVAIPLDPSAAPATFTIGSVPASPSIVSTITTDQTSYLPGQAVQMTFTETNEGSQPVPVIVGFQDFVVSSPDGRFVWESDGVGAEFMTYTLGPGQSFTETDTWNQAWSDGSPVGGGPYVITNLIDPNQNSASIFIPITDPTGPGNGPTSPTPTPGSPSGITYSLTTDQSTYEAGHPVQISYSATNNSDQPVSFDPDNYLMEIWHDGAELIVDSPPFQDGDATPSLTLAPGQSYTVEQIWDTDWPFQDTLPSGEQTDTFVVTINPDATEIGPNGPSGPFTLVPHGPSADFTVLPPPGSVVSPITGDQPVSPGAQAVTLTTNHADYQPGQSVRIELTIPGAGATDLARPRARGPERITVLDGSRVVARMTRRIPAAVVRRIDAGRTVRLTSVWDGRPNQSGAAKFATDDYTIDVTYGNFAGATSIEIGRGR